MKNNKILVTGGAGYIGSHAARECQRAGLEPIIFDNLSEGHAEAVAGLELIAGDVMDRRARIRTERRGAPPRERGRGR